MGSNKTINAPALFGSLNPSWTEKDFKYAVKKFRQNAPTAPIPRLYDAYKWLKEQIDTEDAAADKQFSYFIEHFLRILEERGAGNSEVYTEVLRDSAEFKYLKALFHQDDKEEAALLIEEIKPVQIPEPEIKKISLSEILTKRNISLIDFEINEWHRLVKEHFSAFKNEEPFIKACSNAVYNIGKRTEKDSYHTEIIVEYAFEKILMYKKISLKTKDFAMRLLNLTTDKSELWKKLHREYLEIIRK